MTDTELRDTLYDISNRLGLPTGLGHKEIIARVDQLRKTACKHDVVVACIVRIRKCLDEEDMLNWPQRLADISEDLADAIGDGSE